MVYDSLAFSVDNPSILWYTNLKEFVMDINFNTGLRSELKAAEYYVSEGYALYWPMVTQSRCDFVVEKEGLFKKIQVKTGTWSKAGAYKYLQVRLKTRNRLSTSYTEGDFDEIVFVSDDSLWVAPWRDISDLVSVCLLGTKPGYKPRSSKYDSATWRIK